MRAAEQGMNPVSHNDPNFFLVKTPKQVVTEWAAAFNQSDAAAGAALYHEDATNIRVPFGEPLRGRRAMLENFIEFFRAFPDSYTRSRAFSRMVTGPSCRTFTLRGCGFFQIVDCKIRSQRGYWDRATGFNQLGLPVD
jgi:hypothetical protein